MLVTIKIGLRKEMPRFAYCNLIQYNYRNLGKGLIK